MQKKINQKELLKKIKDSFVGLNVMAMQSPFSIILVANEDYATTVSLPDSHFEIDALVDDVQKVY